MTRGPVLRLALTHTSLFPLQADTGEVIVVCPTCQGKAQGEKGYQYPSVPLALALRERRFDALPAC